MKRWLILLSVGCLAFAGVASASVQKGDTELDALLGWTTQNFEGSGGIDAWWLAGSVGYFVTDNIQIAACGMWASLDVEVADVDVYGLGAKAKYHFMPTNQWVPYVGGQVMWASADLNIGDLGDFFDDEELGDLDDLSGDADGVLWGPVVGARYELNANNDFYVEYQYQLWSGDIGDLLKDGHMVVLGIVHQFK